jgi:hypothetical protein
MSRPIVNARRRWWFLTRDHAVADETLAAYCLADNGIGPYGEALAAGKEHVRLGIGERDAYEDIRTAEWWLALA